jgi:hypothetical protein
MFKIEKVTPQEAWKAQNLIDAVDLAERFLPLIARAEMPHRLNFERFYQEALADVARIKAMDYSKFDHVPGVFCHAA